MDFTSPRYFQSHPNSSTFSSVVTMEQALERPSNPFAESFADPLCKLNLKETSEFVRSFPMPESTRRREGVNSVTATQRRLAADAAPPTPGRPVFGFSSGSPANFPRKSFPSKWDDAEKWLISSSSSCHDSPAHIKASKPSDNYNNFNHCVSVVNNGVHVFKQQLDKFRVTEEKVSKAVPKIHNNNTSSSSSVRGFNGSSDMLLKDKFTDDVEPAKEAFLFKNSACEAMRDAGTEMALRSVEHRDIGTEMTPLGSSTTSRCHTPFKSSSPARHNTPANRSGPLGLGHSDSANSASIDIAQLQECHLAKLQLGNHYDSITSNWSSREEEEEEISKSLRHFDTENGCYKNLGNNVASCKNESRAVMWEEEEKTKCCSRYQREEAKIQAWVNLQSAKAEAQSRKLEVKIQKMRSNLEEKLMKRMAVVHRKAEELRASARQQHSEQIKKATENANNNKTHSHFSTHTMTIASCGCFPCNNHHYWP